MIGRLAVSQHRIASWPDLDPKARAAGRQNRKATWSSLRIAWWLSESRSSSHSSIMTHSATYMTATTGLLGTWVLVKSRLPQKSLRPQMTCILRT